MIDNLPLVKLLVHEDEDAAKLGALINETDKALQAKKITEQEYVELMVDIERVRTVIALKNNVKLNQLIHDAIQGLIAVAKLVKP